MYRFYSNQKIVTFAKPSDMKSYSGSLNIRISPGLHNRIAVLTRQNGISINAVIKQALEKQVHLTK